MAAIFVVGGSSEIGYELSNRLAEQGFDIYATYYQNSIKSDKGNLQYYPLNVCDNNIDLSFLPQELDGLVYCNCVAPSLTDTPLIHNLINTDEKRAMNEQRHPMKRIGKPSDIANAVEFLLSERSSWITGQVLHVDGGMPKLKV